MMRFGDKKQSWVVKMRDGTADVVVHSWNGPTISGPFVIFGDSLWVPVGAVGIIQRVEDKDEEAD